MISRVKPNKIIATALLRWHRDVDREMPWKETKDPYKIWISEIILQQTRVAQGLGYYERFVQTLPDIRALASADEDEVLALWKGLGYYSRARNIHKTAKYIVAHHNGIFPQRYEDILALSGIGPYTAAAIASFAFGQAYAVLDGNVFRVLSRYYGESTPIDTPAGKIAFTALADQSIDRERPAQYNQAIMDLGALICKPSNPQCDLCPLKGSCISAHDPIVNDLPVKSKKTKIRNRFFHYFIMEKEGKIVLQKRSNQDIWKGLYEPPMIEYDTSHVPIEIVKNDLNKQGLNINKIKKESSTTQQLSHQKIHATFYRVEWGGVGTSEWVDRSKAATLAYPRCVDLFLEEYFKGLN
jgi:A/G-specific adenine glycosylase